MRQFEILKIVRGSWGRVRRTERSWDDINVSRLHREGFRSIGRMGRMTE